MIPGHDVSSYQSTTAPSGDFCFVKATEGTNYVNPKMAAQASSARRQGQIVGFYHFLRPGNPIGQARFFVAKAASQDGDLLVCDWEATQSGHATDAEKNEFLAEVARLRPRHMVGLYCNTSDWKNLDHGSHCGDFLWIAEYNNRPGQPSIQYPWMIHQWTSKPMDSNVARFATRAEMRAWARKKLPAPPVVRPPAPAPTPRPNFVAMKAEALSLRAHAQAAMKANTRGSRAYLAAAAVSKLASSALVLVSPFTK